MRPYFLYFQIVKRFFRLLLLTLKDNFHKKHYHQPSDELRDTWDYNGAIQQAEFALRLARLLADQPAVSVWNKGDEFEAAGFMVRKRMQKPSAQRREQ